jgi:hypothetical protein
LTTEGVTSFSTGAKEGNGLPSSVAGKAPNADPIGKPRRKINGSFKKAVFTPNSNLEI